MERLARKSKNATTRTAELNAGIKCFYGKGRVCFGSKVRVVGRAKRPGEEESQMRLERGAPRISLDCSVKRLFVTPNDGTVHEDYIERVCCGDYSICEYYVRKHGSGGPSIGIR